MWNAYPFERLYGFGDAPALIIDGKETTYAELFALTQSWHDFLVRQNIRPGQVVGIDNLYSNSHCALLLALIAQRAIIVPLPMAPVAKRTEFAGIAHIQLCVAGDSPATAQLTNFDGDGAHDLYDRLRAVNTAGLVLFSSGTTGRSKATVLDFHKLLERYRSPGKPRRVLAFLSLDHIGGINTVMHTLCSGGSVVTCRDRTPASIFSAIEQYRVDTLPTTPTFLTMSLISGDLARHDLSSLRLITYGTEPMPDQTLKKLNETLPKVRLKQTYGLSEVGILPTVSLNDNSLWFKLGSDGFEHKIIDNILWIRSEMAMLGYLNADAPFDADGYFNTQDCVETNGEYIRVLGRKSEIINVAGEKVYPNEVESILLEMDNVAEVTVSGKHNPVTGMVVKAKIRLIEGEPADAFKRRLREFCMPRLESYKIPAMVEIDDKLQYSDRFKKIRAQL